MKPLLLALLTFFLLTGTALAADEIRIDPPSPTPASEIQYTMPFPGILPDNPLYALKASRDRIISLFIANPLKKAEFDLLQADKRVQAGLFLLHKEKPDVKLAISTISKGQNYLEEALVSTQKAKTEASTQNPSPTGMTPGGVGDLPDKLYDAARKHNELLRKEAKRFSGQDAKEFQQLIKRSEKYINEAKKIRGEE